MNGIAEIARGLCYVAVTCALIDLLAPEGKLKKVFSIVVGAFILLTVVTSVSGNFSIEELTDGWYIPSPEVIEERGEELKSTVENQTVEVVKAQAEEYIRNVTLNRLGVIPKKLSVTMDISETGSISMKCIEVTVSPNDTDKALVITSELRRDFGSDVTISIKQGWE